MSQEAIGYTLPLFRSLTEQVLFAGAPRIVIAGNCMILAFFVISMHFFWIIPLNIIVHFGAIYLTKYDDQFFECLLGYIRKSNYYTT